MTYHAHAYARARAGGGHNSGIGTFADAGSGVFLVGHIWLLFVLFQLACGTHRWRNLGTKKNASFPTRVRLDFGVVVSWISPWFVTRNPADTRRTGMSENWEYQ